MKCKFCGGEATARVDDYGNLVESNKVGHDVCEYHRENYLVAWCEAKIKRTRGMYEEMKSNGMLDKNECDLFERVLATYELELDYYRSCGKVI